MCNVPQAEEYTHLKYGWNNEIEIVLVDPQYIWDRDLMTHTELRQTEVDISFNI